MCTRSKCIILLIAELRPHLPGSPLDKHFSLYLDLVRFIAAAMVVLSHVVQRGMLGPVTDHPLLMFGREAVMVFFILSGFVIACSTSTARLTLAQYVIARSARIYSVVVPVLALCFVLAAIGSGSFASSADTYQLKKLYLYVPLHLLFLGESWNLAEVPPWLAQYWSLGYEVWYYVLFGICTYLRGVRRAAWGAAALLVMGPKLWLLLPVWLAGVWLYARQRELAIGTWQARAGCLATVLLLVAYKYSGAEFYLRELGSSWWPISWFKLGTADRYLADYLVCVIVYLHFLFARQARLSALAPLAGPIRAVAAYTFTLYLVHGPVMGIWGHFIAPGRASAAALASLAACIGLATWSLGLVTERRKGWFKRQFESLYRLSARRPA